MFINPFCMLMLGICLTYVVRKCLDWLSESVVVLFLDVWSMGWISCYVEFIKILEIVWHGLKNQYTVRVWYKQEPNLT